MDDLDLNISNYNFQDLLSLFKMESDFTTQELKSAKAIVYKVHPDKSGLDKSYFLFFSKAYKMLYQIHQFREGSSNQHDDDTEYKIITSGENSSSRKILEQHKEYAEIKKVISKHLADGFTVNDQLIVVITNLLQIPVKHYQEAETDQITLFSLATLQINPLHHRLVPRHRLVNKKTASQILNHYQYTVMSTPQKFQCKHCCFHLFQTNHCQDQL